jgi:hypothetical protein
MSGDFEFTDVHSSARSRCLVRDSVKTCTIIAIELTLDTRCNPHSHKAEGARWFGRGIAGHAISNFLLEHQSLSLEVFNTLCRVRGW